jgi:hypothetical protein
VRYADEENLPLEMVREPQPGDIPSYPYPARKKPRLLVAPSADDDVPEDNKMVYNVNKPDWQHGLPQGQSPSPQQQQQQQQQPPASQETATATSTAGSATDDEDDEFARMLRDSLAD